MNEKQKNPFIEDSRECGLSQNMKDDIMIKRGENFKDFIEWLREYDEPLSDDSYNWQIDEVYEKAKEFYDK